MAYPGADDIGFRLTKESLNGTGGDALRTAYGQPDLGVLLQQEDGSPLQCSPPGGTRASGAGSDYHYIIGISQDLLKLLQLVSWKLIG